MPEEWNAKTCLSMDWGEVNQTDTGIAPIQCPAIWDGLSCWSPTLAGSTVSSNCPSFRGSDVTKSAYRKCSMSGQWLGRDGIPSNGIGWTNYTPCLTPELSEIMKRLGSDGDAKIKLGIAENARVLEFIGLTLSLAALLLSLLIFYFFRNLRNSRTRLHCHLFIAMVIQVIIRLTVYTDQAITRSFEPSHGNPGVTVDSKDDGSISDDLKVHWGIENTPILCEATYICLEYARTAMFMWMFVEGLFLHNLIAVTVFEERLSPWVYPVIGWILPIPLTAAWATATHLQYGNATCWWGYNLTLYFWIIEGPRLIVLVANLAFLLNILRVIVLKLQKSKSSETQQFKKTVKAALVLLPLLGLTNLLNMINAPLEKSPLEFALWSYSTHLLTSTQGFTLAVIYCFRNAEVQTALRKFVRVRIFGTSRNIILLAKKPSSLTPSSLENDGVYPADVESGGGFVSSEATSQHVSTSTSSDGKRITCVTNAEFSKTEGLRLGSPTQSLVVRSYQGGVLKRIPIKCDQMKRESCLHRKYQVHHQLSKNARQQHHVSQRYYENQRFFRHHSGGCCENYLGGKKVPLLFQQQVQIERTEFAISHKEKEDSINALLPSCISEGVNQQIRHKAN